VRRIAVCVICIFAVLGAPAASFAHGDLRSTTPEAGAKLRTPPKEVRITLTEAPTKGAEARAVDGCKRRVPAAVSVNGNDIVLALRGGEPGNWKVSYRAVSSVDGHQTRGKLAFSVTGKKDCSRDKGDDIDAADNPGIVENPNPPDEGGMSWLLWVGGGTVFLGLAALFIRRNT